MIDVMDLEEAICELLGDVAEAWEEVDILRLNGTDNLAGENMPKRMLGRGKQGLSGHHVMDRQRGSGPYDDWRLIRKGFALCRWPPFPSEWDISELCWDASAPF